jgi:predicted ATP-grasp superfamily ATP-dependent carboligase
MSNNDGAAVAISMSVGEELSRLMVQADHLREENERLREALREISTRNFPEGTATLELRKIARAALGGEE